MKKSTIGIMTYRIITEVGPAAIWDSFIELLDRHYRDSGEKIKIVRKRLLKGKVKPEDAQQAWNEMKLVKEKFKGLPSAKSGTSLYESLMTSTGRNLIDELIDSFAFALENNHDVKIVSYDSIIDTAFIK